MSVSSIHTRCEHFNYGGCGGNGNRFTSLQRCKRRCDPTGKLSITKTEQKINSFRNVAAIYAHNPPCVCVMDLEKPTNH